MTNLAIVLPFYGSTVFLKRSIESIITQTYTNFDLFIGFDGENHIAEEIIKSFNCHNIYLIKYPKRGFIQTLNDLIKHCISYKFIARMDSDDVSIKSRLQTQIEFLEKNPKAGFVTCSYGYISKSSNLICLEHLKTDFSVKRVSVSDILINNSKFDYNFCDPATIYRCEFVKDVGYFDLDIDNERTLQIKLLRKYEGYIIKSILYYCDFNLNSHSNSRHNNALHKLSLLSDRYLLFDEKKLLKINNNAKYTYLNKFFKAIRIYLALKDWGSLLRILFKHKVFFSLKTWKILFSFFIYKKNLFRNVSTPFYLQHFN